MFRGHVPELSEDEATDLYLLWRHGGEDPVFSHYRQDKWVTDLKADGLRAELRARNEDEDEDEELSSESTLDEVPPGLRGL